MNSSSQQDALLEKTLQMLGLARKAGKVSLGAARCIPALSGGTAKLALLALDAGDNTAKKIRDKCAFYHIPLWERLNRQELGRACGLGQAVVLTVNDPGFAIKLEEYLMDINWGA